MDEFVTELRLLSKNCGFTDIDKEILSQVIQHCSSSRFQRTVPREPDKSLTNILDIGRTLELTDKHAASVEKESISAVGDGRNRQTRWTDIPSKQMKNQHQAPKKTCINCGEEYPHSTPCPANGKICHYCKKPNHFKRMCMKLRKKEPINKVLIDPLANDSKASDSASTSSEDEYSYGVHCDEHVVNILSEKTPKVSVKLNDIECQMMIDTLCTSR